jgi:hypothetical protein
VELFGLVKEFDVEKLAFRWKATGAAQLILGILGLALYESEGYLPGLIWGLILIALGAGILFGPPLIRKQ